MKGILCGAVLAGLVSSGAMAAEKSWTVDGNTLSISSPCAKTVAIEPSDESGKVQVTATGRQKEIDRLEISGGAIANIGIKQKSCPSNFHFNFGFLKWGISTDATLELVVRVPHGAAIEIKEANSADYTIGEVDGALSADLSGSGTVAAESVKGKLDGRLSGSGDLSVARAEVGASDFAISGSGDVSVDEGKFDSVSARLSGSGSLSLGEGKIGALTVKSSGSSDVDVDASVGDADLAVSGSGDVRLREATGQVRQSSHGNGSITIGEK